MFGAASLPGGERFPEMRLLFRRNHLSGAASLPGAELFREFRLMFGRSHMSGAASLPGAELFSRNLVFGRNHLSGAASLPGAELFSQTSDFFFEEATCPAQLRCLGHFSSRIRLFLKTPLVQGSFAAWGRTFSQKMVLF